MMRAAWAYFASWPQLATEFAPLSKTKLTMPVLSIGGEKSLGNELGAQMKLVADNVTVIVLPNTGHWILEEKPKETTDALVNFLKVPTGGSNEICSVCASPPMPRGRVP